MEEHEMMKSNELGSVGTRLMGVALVLCLTGAALAGTTSYSGDTTGDPTWQRTVGMSSSLSSVGTAVSYETQAFSVSASGNYTITSAYDEAAGYDGYLHLYASSFDPTDQLTNLMAGDDDYGTVYAAQMADVSLVSGATYIIVNSGFSNDDYGVYTTEITGRGDIQLGGGCPTVPVPTSLGLVAVGCLSVLRRRRR
jgi:hypothetical protein